MASLDDLPSGWTVWSDEPDGRTVLAYRPDVFDADEFPPPCLPTLYLTHGRGTRRPGVNPTDRQAAGQWHVTLYLEPVVHWPTQGRFESREEALEHALELAAAFDAGELDYRSCYQVPREAYLDRLDELTGRDRPE